MGNNGIAGAEKLTRWLDHSLQLATETDLEFPLANPNLLSHNACGAKLLLGPLHQYRVLFGLPTDWPSVDLTDGKELTPPSCGIRPVCLIKWVIPPIWQPLEREMVHLKAYSTRWNTVLILRRGVPPGAGSLANAGADERILATFRCGTL